MTRNLQKKVSLRGFTLVELVVVILIAGILASYGGTKLASSRSFDATISRDAIISLFSNAQLSALGKSAVDVYVESDASSATFSIRVNGAKKKTKVFDTTNLEIKVGTVGFEGSPDNCVALPPSATIAYDSSGEIFSSDQNGIPICVDGVNVACIASSGFIHKGLCQ